MATSTKFSFDDYSYWAGLGTGVLRKTPGDVKVGDNVEFVAKGKVTSIEYGSDVVARLDTGAGISLASLTKGEVALQKKTSPRPKVGDKVTGQDIRDHMWKAGTTFVSQTEASDTWTIHKDGKLHSNNGWGDSVAIEKVNVTFKGVLVYDAGSKN